MTSEADAIREFNEKANADEANANALKKLCKGTGFTIYPQQLSEPGKPCSPDDPITYAVYDDSEEPHESNYYGMLAHGFDSVADALAYIREITKARIQ
jgi:hypothetical protein